MHALSEKYGYACMLTGICACMVFEKCTTACLPACLCWLLLLLLNSEYMLTQIDNSCNVGMQAGCGWGQKWVALCIGRREVMLGRPLWPPFLSSLAE